MNESDKERAERLLECGAPARAARRFRPPVATDKGTQEERIAGLEEENKQLRKELAQWVNEHSRFKRLLESTELLLKFPFR